MSDYLFLDRLKLNIAVGLDAFSRPDLKFPLLVSLTLWVPKANGDTYSISYGDLSRSCQALESNSYESLEVLAADIESTLSHRGTLRTLDIIKIGGMARAKREGYRILQDGAVEWSVEGVTIPCFIGIYEYEQGRKQDVKVDIIILHGPFHSRPKRDAETSLMIEEYRRTMLDAVCGYIEESKFKTLEALAEQVSELSLGALPEHIPGLRVWISKPTALIHVDNAGICVTRMRS